MEPTTNPAPVMEPKVSPSFSMGTMPPVTPTPSTPPVMPPVQSVPPVVPPTPPITPKAPHDHKEVRVVLPALLLVLIIAAGYYWYISRSKTPGAYTPTATSTPISSSSSTPGTIARPTDVPSGFPLDIPVEKTNLTEAYKIEYKDHNVTQLTVSYLSSKSKSALWTLYTNALSTGGYTTNAAATSQAQGVIDAKKDTNEVNIVISSHGAESLVQITYLVR